MIGFDPALRGIRPVFHRKKRLSFDNSGVERFRPNHYLYSRTFMAKYRIAWLPGDGIGGEVLEAAEVVLAAAVQVNAKQKREMAESDHQRATQTAELRSNESEQQTILNSVHQLAVGFVILYFLFRAFSPLRCRFWPAEGLCHREEF